MQQYNLTPEQEDKEISRRYKDLLKGAYQTFTDSDKIEIRKAFDLALKAHSKQRRSSGEPYIFHPISVAKIVAYEIGLDTTSIVSALLHDVVEDTEYTIQDIQEHFGEQVAVIVDGLTKISFLNKEQKDSVQAENFRKMLLTLHDDVRVILIKIADRFHNMQTLGAMREDKRFKIASETLYIYAPLAHRLGLYNIKTELENLGLKYTEPDVYQHIEEKINEGANRDNKYLEEFSSIVKQHLDKEGFQYQLKARTKSIYSIRKKMRAQNVTYEQVYDKFAVRIIYKSTPKNEKFESWKIYSVITDHFSPNPIRMRDWISQPKSTGYESLHITVMGPLGKWIEVQIRSERMDEIAEKGYAAHYKYKNQNEKDNGLDDWLNKIKESLENPNENAVDFVEDFKLNLYAKEIFVFTPKGELKELPKGATALDFAFSIHTQVGLTCRGAKVNGILRPISHELKSGDQVDIFTSSNQKPNPGWLDFVITARAKTKIKNALKEDQKQIAEDGKELLRRKLRQLKVNMTEKFVHEMASHFKLKTSLDLFYRMGSGTIDNEQVKHFVTTNKRTIVNFFKNKIKRHKSQAVSDQEEITTNFDALVFGDEEEKLNYTTAKCCTPIPGDKVFGFLTINEGIKVHLHDCPNAISMRAKYAYRIINAKWIDSNNQSFKAIIKMSGMDQMGMISQISEIVAKNFQLNIHNLSIGNKGDTGLFEGKITVEVKNNGELQKLLDELKKIKGIEKIKRVLHAD
jgi:GTP pyrophosphokinase